MNCLLSCTGVVRLYGIEFRLTVTLALLLNENLISCMIHGGLLDLLMPPILLACIYEGIRELSV